VQLKSSELAIGLACAQVFMINALNNRPGDYAAHRAMVASLLPAVLEDGEAESDDDEVQVVNVLPQNVYGLFCIAMIRLDDRTPVPRLDARLRLSRDVLQHLSGGATLKELEYQAAVGQRPQIKTNPARVTNKQKTTTLVDRVPQDADVIQLLPTMCGRREVQLLTLADADEGSDLEAEDVVYGVRHESVNDMVQTAWLQMLRDILVKSSNPRGSGNRSYLLPSALEREEKSVALFASAMGLGSVFRCAYIKVASRKEWQDLFDICWPRIPWQLQPKSQNWPQVRWPTLWQTIVAKSRGNDKKALSTIRTALREAWEELAWFPAAKKDRIWFTKSIQGAYRRQGEGESLGPAPRILINPLHASKWSW
jgi:hypothetical protein